MAPVGLVTTENGMARRAGGEEGVVIIMCAGVILTAEKMKYCYRYNIDESVINTGVSKTIAYDQYL